MVQWLFVLVYDLAILQLSLSEVTLSLRLIHYKNRNGLTYENRPCDTRIEHDINRDGRCDTGFLFCLVRLPFQNPHNCTLGDHFTGFVGADDIHFINIDQKFQRSTPTRAANRTRQRSSLVSLWFQPTIYFRFKYPKNGIGIIVEVFDIDDPVNQTKHDSIDFYGRTLLDLKLYRSADVAQPQRLYLRSLFGFYTNLTADVLFYCSPNFYGEDCETHCIANVQRYDCDPDTGQKICKHGYIGQDCLSDVQACEDQPCLNNGTCVVYVRGYLCQCPVGFTGRNCETNLIVKPSIDLCNRTTCIHGDCLKNGTCLCHKFWSGEKCNRKEMNCANQPCLHNSTCENLLTLSDYRCHCNRGYTGRNCEVEIVTSCERTPCIHGQCLKIDFYTEICICEQHWTGIDCSQSLTTSTISTTTTTTTTTTTKPTTRLSTSTIAKDLTSYLTNTSFTTDLSEYFNWPNVKYRTSSSTNTYQTSTPYKNTHSPCLSTPCLHNSTCIILSNHSFQCLCSSSFIGIYCEIETNPCENSPCRHDSICVTKSNHDVQCICSSNYTGRYCENTVTIAKIGAKCTRICQNGGSCSINHLNEEYCLCRSSYTGFSCEIVKNNCTDSSCSTDPCLPNPCLFNRTCHSTNNSTNFTCSCPENSSGELCEYVLESDSIYALSQDHHLSDVDENLFSKTSPDLWPLAIVFGYVFSLMLVFIIIWFLWYGLTNRPQSYFQSEIPHHERANDRYEPYRLGVSNPLFFLNQEYNPNSILKTY